MTEEQNVLRWRVLAEVEAARFFAPGLERDDLRQEALLGVLQALRAHDPAVGPPGPLVAALVRRRLMDAVTAARRLKHDPINRAASLTAGDADTAPGPEREVLARETLEELADEIRCLPERQRLVVLSRWGGASYEEIAARHGLPWKAVDKALTLARERFARRLAA